MFSVFFYVWWKTASIVQFFFHFSSFWLHKCTCSLPSTIQRILEKCFSHTLESKRMKSLIFFLWKMKKNFGQTVFEKWCSMHNTHPSKSIVFILCFFFSPFFYIWCTLFSIFSEKLLLFLFEFRKIKSLFVSRLSLFFHLPRFFNRSTVQT